MAGIVTYHPDEARLARLVAAVAPDVREVAVFANSEIGTETEARLRSASGMTALTVLRPGGNRGLGAAYNALVDRALARGDTFLFLLDQDSLPAPGTVRRLAGLHRRLAQAGERPAIVGPQPVGADGRPMRLSPLPGPVPPGLDAVRAAFVISSGSLLACDTVREVGPFRADFFIDAIDLEWCMRANHRGFSIWAARDVAMDHELGRGVIRLPFGLLLADQPPRRLYTFIRNQLAMLRLPHVPRAHKARTVLAMPIRIVVYLARNRFSPETRLAIRRGLSDGLRHRLVQPARVFDERR